MLRVLKPGLQTTLQGAPRIGYRHFGVPYAGPADAVSMALANRLVGNARDDTCLEITFGGFEAEIEVACSIAVTGAAGHVSVSDLDSELHQTLHLKPGDRLQITPPRVGARAYLAVHSGFEAQTQFGSTSTYLPAKFGGYEGRAIQSGDVLSANAESVFSETRHTPGDVRPVFTRAFGLRACESAETDLLDPAARDALFHETFQAGRQTTRMGVSLEGPSLKVASDGRMKSAPVFPGTVQCPPSGVPIVLLCDAQTTGGYPRIASIARCDRHLLGQIRPGDQITLLHRAPDAALRDYQEKGALLASWLEL
jgi:biotin-dependent carboxylase-like uncharacterized protein